MANHFSFEHLLKTSLISAFTFAVALIWKDFLMSAIDALVPTGDAIYYQLLVAVLATVIIIVAIYAFLKTEHEAHYLLRKINTPKKRKKK